MAADGPPRPERGRISRADVDRGFDLYKALTDTVNRFAADHAPMPTSAVMDAILFFHASSLSAVADDQGLSGQARRRWLRGVANHLVDRAMDAGPPPLQGGGVGR